MEKITNPKINKAFVFFSLSLFITMPTFITSCKTNNNERDWNKGVKFQNLKIGDDLSDKSASFDIMSVPYTTTVDQLPAYRNVNNIFIKFGTTYMFNLWLSRIDDSDWDWDSKIEFSGNSNTDTIIERNYLHEPIWKYHDDGYGNLGRFYRNKSGDKLIYKFNDGMSLKITSLNINEMLNDTSCLNYLENSILFGYF